MLFTGFRAQVHADWNWLAGTPTSVLVILLAAFAARFVIHRAINRAIKAVEHRDDETSRWRSAAGLDDERRRQRATTMGSLLKSVTTVTIIVISALTIAAQIGIQLGPLMASAGVAGVALGIGAQSLVKDFLSGIFMIFEDQYGVGDVIDTGEVVGTVEDVTLRITRLRDGDGVTWYVRNGEIKRIANRSQGWATALVDIPVGYAAKVDVVSGILKNVCAELYEDAEWAQKLTAEPTMAGVESLTAGAVTFRLVATTTPGANIPAARELRGRALEALAQAGVPGPTAPSLAS